MFIIENELSFDIILHHTNSINLNTDYTDALILEESCKRTEVANVFE